MDQYALIVIVFGEMDTRYADTYITSIVLD